MFTLQHLWLCHELKIGVFDAGEKKLYPIECSCHRRLKLIYWWFIFLRFKDFVYAVNLRQRKKTKQNIIIPVVYRPHRQTLKVSCESGIGFLCNRFAKFFDAINLPSYHVMYILITGKISNRSFWTSEYLLAILSQDVIKLSHQIPVDGLSYAHAFELLEHLKGGV